MLSSSFVMEFILGYQRIIIPKDIYVHIVSYDFPFRKKDHATDKDCKLDVSGYSRWKSFIMRCTLLYRKVTWMIFSPRRCTLWNRTITVLMMLMLWGYIRMDS